MRKLKHLSWDQLPRPTSRLSQRRTSQATFLKILLDLGPI